MKAKYLGVFGSFCTLSIGLTVPETTEAALVMTDYAPIGGSATAVGTGVSIPSSATAVRPSNVGPIITSSAGNPTAAGIGQTTSQTAPAASPPQQIQSGSPSSQQTAATATTGGEAPASETPSGSGTASKPAPSGTGARSNSRKTPSAPTQQPAGTAVSSPGYDPKGPLPEVIVSEPEAFWKITANAGWQSDYYFRGLNVLSRISPTGADDGVVSGKVDFGYAFADGSEIDFGVGYVESVDQLLPRGAAKILPPNPGATRFNEDFEIPSLERYTETNFLSSYRRTLVPDQLNAQIGVNYYKFSDGRFWEPEGKGGPVDDTTEIMAGLSYVGLAQYVIPTFTYVKDVDAFDGSFLSLRTDFPSLTLLQNAGFGGITLSPFAAASYDIGYNAPGDGWNNIDLGLNASIPIGSSGVALNLTGNYVIDLSDGERSDEGFWGGVSISAYLDSRSFANDHLVADPKSVVFATPADDNKWSLSVGAGVKGTSASFDSKPVEPYDALSLVKRRKGSGDLGFASGRDAHYKDGTVYGGFDEFNDGTADFRISNNGQILGSYENGDRQLVFSSDRYSYDSESSSYDNNTSDHDDVIYPYVRLLRELDFGAFAKLPFAVEAGFQYSFNRSEFDNGTSLAAVTSAYETYENYNFIYDVDEIFSDMFSGPVDTRIEGIPAWVIVDPAKYDALYTDGSGVFAGNSPQRTDTAVRTEVAKVAIFTHSDLQVDAHEFALPIGLQFDLGERIHLGLEVAPSVNLFNSSLNTTVYTQRLDNLSGGELIRNNTSFQRRGIAGFEVGAGRDVVTIGTSSAEGGVVAAATPQPATGQPLPGGRAGGRVLAPQLPGTTLDTYRVANDQQDVQFGISAQANILFDLDSSDTWFLELWARYSWIDEFTVSNGLVSANVDPSSFSGGIGLGYRF